MKYQSIEEYLNQFCEPAKVSRGVLSYHCPIHKADRTPSFFVNISKQVWYCHGACDEGGDIFKLILRLEELPETSYGWAKAFAIQKGEQHYTMIHKKKRQKPPQEKKAVTPIQKGILTFMTQWWHHHLGASTYGAEEARDYLIYHRGISNAVMKLSHSAIGYCPQDPDGTYFRQVFKMIHDTYGQEGIHTAHAMGIFYEDQRGILHLSQQHRIVFSSFDPTDFQTVYFQGRIISKEHLPGCYIGARGLPKAPFWIPIQDPILEGTIIVESPFGTAALAAHSIPSVATLGNNPDIQFLTHFPGIKLWGQDNDSAGEKQAAKYQRYCEREGLPFYRLRPSEEDKDIDKWIHHYGIRPLLDMLRAEYGQGLFKSSCFIL